MKEFNHFNPRSTDEASEILARYDGRASVIAGGTDLLGIMKDRVLPGYPEALVNIKKIPGLDRIEEFDGKLVIGACTRLSDVAENETVRGRYRALAMAAERVASPNLRNMGTVGGNICQDIRCWYYRTQNNRFSCLRKGGGRCYAIKGDNRFHSIFGGTVEGGCFAVHPSDVAPALVALNAVVVTTKRRIPIEYFFSVNPMATTVLERGEVAVEIEIPVPAPGAKSAFMKFAQRKSIDFPIANCAVLVNGSPDRVESARICMNAVWVNPFRAEGAEKAVTGRAITEESADEAGSAAVSKAKPMEHNAYIVNIAKAMVKRALLACRE